MKEIIATVFKARAILHQANQMWKPKEEVVQWEVKTLKLFTRINKNGGLETTALCIFINDGHMGMVEANRLTIIKEE